MKNLVFAALLSIGAAAPAAAKASAHPRYDSRALSRLLERIAKVQQSHRTPVVIFDIDDTLTYPTERNLAILKDFLAQPEIQAGYPQEVAKLRELDSFSEMGYSLMDSAKAFGASDELVKKLNDFWAPRFFTSEYLSHDTEVPGASEFVRKVARAGAVVVYFTGRNPSMVPGTEATLKKYGFPVPDGDKVRLVIKENKDQPDAEFKEMNLAAFAKLGVVVGGFENEPKHINLFAQHYPDGIMVFVDTHQSHPVDESGKPIEPQPSVAWVKDYRLP